MNAEVTMPIAQLDELRESLKKSQEECKTLQKNKSKIELTVRLQYQERDYDRERMEFRMRAYEHNSKDVMGTVRTHWDGTLSVIPSYARFKTVEQTIFSSFENVDHFLEPFTNIAREQVRSELSQAEQVAHTAVQDLAIAKGNYARMQAETQEAHDKELFTASENYKLEVKRLENIIEQRDRTIKELKNEAVLLSKDEQITKLDNTVNLLMKAISDFNSLSKWSKLTNSIKYPDLDKILK